ncbi:MAG: hypothetical protein U0599_28510 [Vicinamibacteria bacterium]
MAIAAAALLRSRELGVPRQAAAHLGPREELDEARAEGARLRTILRDATRV